MKAPAYISAKHHATETDRKVGYFLTFIGILAVAGWIGDFNLLRSWFPGLPEMRINNAIATILIGVGLISNFHLFQPKSVHNLLLVALFVNGCLGIVEPVLPFSIRSFIIGAEANTSVEDGEFILSSSGFNFLLLSFTLLFTSQNAYGWRAFGQGINAVIIGISGLTLLGYLFQDPGLEILTLSQGMSLPTALSFLALAIIIALNEEEIGLGKLFSKELTGNALARMVFPFTIGTVILLATIFIFATQRHWFEPQSTMTILVSIFIMASLLITWYIVRTTNLIDAKRQAAKDELELVNESLEKQIRARTQELSIVTERLELATRGAGISIWEWDLPSDTFKGNEIFYELIDQPVNTQFIHSREMSRMVHPEDLKLAQNAFHSAREQDSALDLVHRIVKKSGDIRYVRVKGFPKRDSNGKTISFYGAHWDVTELLLSEERIIKQSKELEILSNRLTMATKGARIGVWDMDLKTNEVVWNDEMFNIYDLDSSDFDGNHRSWADRVHPDDFACLSAITDVINTGEDFSCQFRIYHKDGSLHTIKSDGFMQHDANGEITHMIGTNVDITDQVLAQSALRESYELNKRFVEQTPSAIAMFDKEMRYLAASERWKTDYHIENVDIIGKSHYEIFPDLPEFRKKLHRDCMDGLVLKNEEEAFPMHDGSTRWFSWEMRPWFTHGNEIGGILMFTAEHTERREQQAILKETKENLEKLSIKLLRQNKLLADFAHITSHNLRAPVGNLNTLHNFYMEANGCEEKELIYSKFSTVVDHITTTLNELVTALKIKEESDRSIETLRLDETFNKISTILTGQIAESKASIEVDFTQVPSISYHRLYLESIFQNLVSNALKYRSPDRKLDLKIWSKKIDGNIHLFFEDNGLGIDLDKNGHKLFGLHKTFHRHSDSHGVGLFLTKTQIEAMGGEISAKSKVEEGTTFIIKLNQEL